MTTVPTLELKEVSKDVYFALPIDSTNGIDERGPRIILIFGWMEAQLTHLKKYMATYAKLYPHASQILVRSRQSFFWSSRKANRDRLTPVLDILRDHGMFKSSPPSLLIHAFSNGGGFQVVELSQMLESMGIAHDETPLIAIVYDSLPGNLELGSALAAFTPHIKSTLLWLIVSIPLTALYYLTVVSVFITRQPHLFEPYRNRLNTAKLLPWTNEKTPRVYMYSDTDKLVQAEAVSEHIAEAKRLGLNAQGELFKGSVHVSHARSEPERYWNLIERTWTEALAGQH